MPDYKKMYYKMYNKITDTIEILEKEIEELRRIQITAEEMYISENDEENNNETTGL